uniref:Uncharacterized protein n=1 Tax=Rhizophora mucronata TaxID=61149 RepID=A0A2P2JYG3_RHIMU
MACGILPYFRLPICTVYGSQILLKDICGCNVRPMCHPEGFQPEVHSVNPHKSFPCNCFSKQFLQDNG